MRAMGYIPSHEVEECEPASLCTQVQELYNGLSEIVVTLDELESSMAARCVSPELPDRLDGLTNLVLACHAVLGDVRLRVHTLAQRIGRL